MLQVSELRGIKQGLRRARSTCASRNDWRRSNVKAGESLSSTISFTAYAIPARSLFVTEPKAPLPSCMAAVVDEVVLLSDTMIELASRKIEYLFSSKTPRRIEKARRQSRKSVGEHHSFRILGLIWPRGVSNIEPTARRLMQPRLFPPTSRRRQSAARGCRATWNCTIISPALAASEEYSVIIFPWTLAVIATAFSKSVASS
mmetsp:Transcript_11347/g.34142  ORF Transcript_11347/g.34142 Transcript_11347/m.34142 type:complete len:202 (+) Transcript_11347:4556-5161(+)